MNSTIDSKISVKELIEQAVGSVQWVSENQGYCKCPGYDMHTKRHGKKDCLVYADDPIWLNCFHDSCRVVCEETASKIRSSLKEHKITFQPYRQRNYPEPEKEIKAVSPKILTAILEKYKWVVDAGCFDERLGGEGDWKIWLLLWQDNDIVWNGDVYDSGDGHSKNFRTRKQFLEQGPLGNFTCGSAFKTGTFHRTNENVQTPRYLICESDKLTHDQTLSVFLFIRESIKLRMIVDAGNKSLHGWFDWPTSPLTLKILRTMLPEIGFDRQTLKESQPVRLPGVMRGERWQKIYWVE